MVDVDGKTTLQLLNEIEIKVISYIRKVRIKR